MNNRQAFFETLIELAEKDKKVFLIVIDVGFSYIDEYMKRFPNQFLNAGVTEQSAMGVAAGMALSGFKPYIYSMIPFVTMRNYEQLRNDVCYHKCNVKVIGVRGSVHYKFLGFSHNPEPENEEELILSHLPNLKLYFPKDHIEVKENMLEMYNNNSPDYIRL